MLLGSETAQAVADEFAAYLKGKTYNGIVLH